MVNYYKTLKVWLWLRNILEHVNDKIEAISGIRCTIAGIMLQADSS